MNKHLKTATMGILAASLLFSQGALANNGKADKEKETNAVVTTESEVTVEQETEETEAQDADKYLAKVQRIQAKLEQFSAQKVPTEAMLGKLGSTQNRTDALKAQLDELAVLEEEVATLEEEEAKTATNSLAAVYEELGKLEAALKVQTDLAKKLHEGTDEEILTQYKEVGKLLNKMGKVGVKALVNGEEPQMDVQPLIENGRTLVPFRAIAEALGAEKVEWDAETRTVTVTKGDLEVVLTIDNLVATVDGTEYKLDVPAKIKDGRTVIPLRFLSEALKCKVLWEQETSTAVVIEQTPTTETTTEENATLEVGDELNQNQ